MDQKQQILAMYHDLLIASGVIYDDKQRTYYVFNNQDVLFSIKYSRFPEQYELNRSDLLMSEYKKNNLNTELIPNLSDLYSWVLFQSVIFDFHKNANKNVEQLYNKTLVHSDIEFEQTTFFERYNVYGQGRHLYTIAYDPNRKKYGFKRNSKMNVIYYTLDIPIEKKPDYAKLYERVKQQFLAQCALENIQHIDEI